MLQLTKLFRPTASEQSQKAMEDPTFYKVTTQTDTYCGRISYQDSMIIWLKAGDKPIKILKQNIVRINIL